MPAKRIVSEPFCEDAGTGLAIIMLAVFVIGLPVLDAVLHPA